MRHDRDIGMVRLGDLAAEVGGRLEGDPDLLIEGVAALDTAGRSELGFIAHKDYLPQLTATGAGAVVLHRDWLESCPCAAIVTDDPQLAFARIARRLHPRPPVAGGIHPSAEVADGASVDETAWIGPGAVVEAGVEIGARVSVGPGCVIGDGSRIGPDCRLIARVTVLAATLGARVLVQPGAVIGSDGFGYTRDGEQWLHVPQLGGVRLGDDVEIGANTTVDRGALADTVIEAGAKLDNLIQVAHNCRVGANTIIAASSGMAGSTVIGRNCMIGGHCAIGGHLEIADGVVLTGRSMITRSVTEPGVYSSGTGLQPNREWRKSVARFRELDDLARRVRQLEKLLERDEGQGSED